LRSLGLVHSIRDANDKTLLAGSYRNQQQRTSLPSSSSLQNSKHNSTSPSHALSAPCPVLTKIPTPFSLSHRNANQKSETKHDWNHFGVSMGFEIRRVPSQRQTAEEDTAKHREKVSDIHRHDCQHAITHQPRFLFLSLALRSHPTIWGKLHCWTGKTRR
jgi:hypothetical protein